MPERSPAFQFYPKDFLMSPKVRRMSMTERGIYVTLLSLCWLDGSLTTDLAILAHELQIPAQRFQQMWANGPLHECFQVVEGRLVNVRLDVERQKQAAYRERQTTNARKGGRPKTLPPENPRLTRGLATANPSQSPCVGDGKANDRVLGSSSEGGPGETVPLDVWLEQLQADYPEQRVTHGYLTSSAFFEVFDKDERPAVDVWAAMRSNLENQKRGYEWRVKGMVPSLEKWLSEGRWRQHHDEHPVSTVVSDKTARTLSSAAAFIKAGTRGAF